MEEKSTKKGTMVFLFFLVPLLLIIFLSASYIWTKAKRKLPSQFAYETNTAIRGSVITSDGFFISTSKKLYKVQVDTRSIDPNKLDLFVNLYSIYTSSDKAEIKKKILSSKGTVTLSGRINSKTATQLKALAKKLNQMKVFVSFRVGDRINGPVGMSITESGEKRVFLTDDALTPIIGYMKKNEVENLTKVVGQKGVERYYEEYLKPSSDGLLEGPRDLANNIILEKNSLKSKRIDGYDAVLNIPIKLQRSVEILLSKSAAKYGASEIVAGIMNSQTGEILTLATSLRYNPNKIYKKDLRALNSTASEYSYEPGSVIKPVVFATVYENGKIDLSEEINTYNGAYKLNRRTIRDTSPAKSMNVKDVLVKSSNIGMIQLATRLDAKQLYDGFKDFKFGEKTGVDLPFEQKGIVPSINTLQNETYKATVSYGYGIQATFLQLLNAFNVFNNDGFMVPPRLVTYLHKNGEYYRVDEVQKEQIISHETAKVMKELLVEVVQRGTGRKAKTAGIEVGGKTGTARVAGGGGYTNAYNSSFFGFANDKSSSYTIGVFVNKPTIGSYYAAQNALPIFKNIIDIMIAQGYLEPEIIEKNTQIPQESLEHIKD
ncbi:MAG: penicillin-binding protein 2 [Campylobacter sp.]|nr:penicillin-binding protein 2 [Campylobacter sp.]